MHLRLSTKQWVALGAAGLAAWWLLRGSRSLAAGDGLPAMPSLGDLLTPGSGNYASPYVPKPLLSLSASRTVDNDWQLTPEIADKGLLLLTSKVMGFGFLGRVNDDFPLWCNGVQLSGINGDCRALAATTTFAQLVRAEGPDIELAWPNLAPPSLTAASFGGFSSEWTRESWPEDGVSDYLRGMEANCRVLSPNGGVYHFINGIASAKPIGNHHLSNPRIDWAPDDGNLLWVGEGK